MSNRKPVAIKAIKDGFMVDGSQFCEVDQEYSIINIEKSVGSELRICAHTMAGPAHWWDTNNSDFKSHFDIVYEDEEDPFINLQVDKVELGLLFKLVNGNRLVPAEKRELYDLRAQIEKLLYSVQGVDREKR